MEFVINYWAVLVAGISNMVVGILWYGPLFGKSWAVEMGWGNKSKEEMAQIQKAAQPGYLKSFIGALLMAYVFAHVLIAFESDSVSLAVQGALWMWLGFVVPVMYGKVLWENKSHKLFAIDSFYYLVALAAMSLILTLWK